MSFETYFHLPSLCESGVCKKERDARTKFSLKVPPRLPSHPLLRSSFGLPFALSRACGRLLRASDGPSDASSQENGSGKEQIRKKHSLCFPLSYCRSHPLLAD